MSIVNKKKLYAFCASCLLHASLFMLVFIHFHFLNKSPSIGNKSAVVRSYLLQTQPHSTAQISSNKPLPLQKTHKAANRTLRHIAEQNLTTSSSATQLQPKTDSQSAAAETLLLQLHNAIQAAQVYPASALEMQRAGRVTIAFILAPDGNISQLQLLGSSGTDSLDAAALAAVAQISPFRAATKYLTSPKTFQLDVVFELPAEIA